MFTINQSSYPCIGMRTNAVMGGLKQVGPGDLVRVTGNIDALGEDKSGPSAK